MQTQALTSGHPGRGGHGGQRQTATLGSLPGSASRGAGFQAARGREKPFLNRKQDGKGARAGRRRMLGLEISSPSIFERREAPRRLRTNPPHPALGTSRHEACVPGPKGSFTPSPPTFALGRGGPCPAPRAPRDEGSSQPRHLPTPPPRRRRGGKPHPGRHWQRGGRLPPRCHPAPNRWPAAPPSPSPRSGRGTGTDGGMLGAGPGERGMAAPGEGKMPDPGGTRRPGAGRERPGPARWGEGDA